MNKALLNFILSQLAGLATPILIAIANGTPTGGTEAYLTAHPWLLFLYPLVQQAARELLNVIGVSKPASTSTS